MHNRSRVEVSCYCTHICTFFCVNTLTCAVFCMHNRSRVEVFCYALSPNDGSQWRQRIEAGTEHFIDASSWGTGEVCVCICVGLARTINIRCIQCILLGLHQIYGRIRRIYTVLANPMYVCVCAVCSWIYLGTCVYICNRRRGGVCVLSCTFFINAS